MRKIEVAYVHTAGTIVLHLAFISLTLQLYSSRDIFTPNTAVSSWLRLFSESWVDEVFNPTYIPKLHHLSWTCPKREEWIRSFREYLCFHTRRIHQLQWVGGKWRRLRIWEVFRALQLVGVSLYPSEPIGITERECRQFYFWNLVASGLDLVDFG